MSDRLTSRKEADEMKAAISECADDLERCGFSRAQIGRVMVGIGLALVAVNSGQTDAMRVLDGVRDTLMAQRPNA